MADKRLFEIAQLLLDRTETRTVEWEKGAKKGEFQTSFAKYSVVIGGSSDIPNLTLYDEDGDIVEDLSYAAALGSPGMTDIMKRLYALARRRALGSDEALDEILNSLRRGKT